jgi:hypothetical protein
MLRGDTRQPRSGDERPVGKDAHEAGLAQAAQLRGIRIAVLRFSPEGSFVQHRLADGGFDAVGPDEDIARRGGSILEAELDRPTRALGITFQAL